MPAKPLNPEQLADAARLREWVALRKNEDKSMTQERIAAETEMTQGAVTQYANGKIPLNWNALLKFARVLRVHPRQISPTLTGELRNGLRLVMPEELEAKRQSPAAMDEIVEVVRLYGSLPENRRPALLDILRDYAGQFTAPTVESARDNS